MSKNEARRRGRRAPTLEDPRRRQVLAGLTAAVGTSVLTPGAAYALSEEAARIVGGLGNFTPAEGRCLLAVARTLFPHDFLGDLHYARGLSSLDTMAEAAEKAALVRGGLERLPADFELLDQAAGETALAALEGTPFFRLVRRVTVDAIYRSTEAWPHFGYPGPSLPFGGWVNRELVDIDWLPGDS